MTRVTNDALRCYREYLALKRHFSSDYDYFKYHGKVNASAASLEKRRDRYYFEKLAKRADYDTLFLSNLSVKPDTWIGDLANSPECERIHTDWLKRQQSITRVLQQDLGKLNDDFNSNFVPVDGQVPHVVTLYQAREIAPETLVILDETVNFFKRVENKVVDTILFPRINSFTAKYKPFVKYDKEKTTGLIRRHYALQS